MTTSTVSNNTSEAIPDDPDDYLGSFITIPAGGSSIWDVDVTTNVTHTSSGQLLMLLYSPGGDEVYLVDGQGASNDNIFAGTTWDDSSTNLVDGFAFTNLVTPANLSPSDALGAFIGGDPTGDWELDIVDQQAGNSGTLVSWSLTITRCEIETTALPNKSARRASNAWEIAPRSASLPAAASTSMSLTE